jgi:hypothetical protein
MYRTCTVPVSIFCNIKTVAQLFFLFTRDAPDIRTFCIPGIRSDTGFELPDIRSDAGY